MSAPTRPQELHGNQRDAVAPDRTVWLSASAGTGKTQVLSSRVLRLLLQPGVQPSQILCLTFTKAGATEMAGRINAKLASWVRLGDSQLAAELKAIGAEFGETSLERARRLFAEVLDCPGGGLRIDTIHAFAQWLLAAFPFEAGLSAGTRPMEDRDRVLLQRQVLSDMLVAAEAEVLGDPQLLEALADLSISIGPAAVEKWLLACAGEHHAWFGSGAFQEPMRPHVLRLLGLDSDADESDVVALCGDDAFAIDALELCLSAYRQWPAATGEKAVAAISEWLGAAPAERLARFDDLFKLLFTADEEVRNRKNVLKFEEHFEVAGKAVLACMVLIRDLRSLLALAGRLVPALRLARAFAYAWDEAKKREGLIDFDDQIRSAAELLTGAQVAQWIGYKLDRQFDHVLVDEAQDTNAAQWRIIDALTQDYFAGLGQRDAAMRTLFVVGDYKQAIFRFQGTSPENFRKASERVRGKMDAGVQIAEDIRANFQAQKLLDLGLDRSFRTGQPVLDFVDSALGEIGHDRFGLDKPAERHQGAERPGLVTLWRPVGQVVDGGEEEGDPGDAAPDEAGEEGAPQGWLSRPERLLADRIARQVRAWLDEGFPLFKDAAPGQPRRAGAGDIMVLLRKRGDLASLVVALLAKADFGPPQALLHWLLVGPWQARRRLVARLGREANDPIDELLNAAHAWSMSAVPSLTGFIAWFDASEGELKREADNARGQVRVMTVHGAKGLQAPIVILADATADPSRSGRGEMVVLADPANTERSLPIPGLRKTDHAGRIAEAAEVIAREADQEHWRLLYVAMTRAEEALFVGGALGAREKEPATGSWYAALQSLFGALEWRESGPIWGGQLTWGDWPEAQLVAPASEPAASEPARPLWLDVAPAAEPRPYRPLAPSALGEDAGSDPPHAPGSGAMAARRGVLIHRLLERLPELGEGTRAAAAEKWLARNAGELDPASRAEIAARALAVLAEPEWAELFGPEALAEAPIAALVGTAMVTGTIDRLLIEPTRIRLIDFKSARRPPTSIEEVPRAVLRQMGAYAAALEATFPGRRVEAALLYTQTPQLIAIPAAILDEVKQLLQGAQ